MNKEEQLTAEEATSEQFEEVIPNPEELLKLAKERGITLTEEQLDLISGGNGRKPLSEGPDTEEELQWRVDHCVFFYYNQTRHQLDPGDPRRKCVNCCEYKLNVWFGVPRVCCKRGIDLLIYEKLGPYNPN
ncbi:MAG: hypothetical protein LBL80_05080 [Ruminococcus sp.]|jgi:hypothetical protein|nr:hypothetical protein [Ruminococcus sp.]